MAENRNTKLPSILLVLALPAFGVIIAIVCFLIVFAIYGAPGGPYDFDAAFALYASLTTNLIGSAWLYLYACSGFLLIAARRFDIGFDWFNRKFDIEKKPLQSIGLVAGAIVAITYWVAVGISHVL